MKKIAILTASTISLDDKMKDSNNHFMIYLTAKIDTKEYTDESINLNQYLELLLKSKEQAQTSQPSTGEIASLYNEILKVYDAIIVLSPSQHLSGTYQNMLLACEGLESSVFVVDSRNMAMNENIMFYYIQDLIKQGLEPSDIFHQAQEYANKIVSYAIPASFEFLKKGGRVNLSQAVLGSVLNIKIVIKVECEGAFVANKSRGLKKTFQFFEQEIKTYQPTHVVLSHIEQNPKEAKIIKEFFESKNIKVHETDHASIICGTHFGPQTTGIAMYKGVDYE